MPVYEYYCDECGHKTFAITAIQDRDGVTDTGCAECNGEYKRSVGNRGGFRLKGFGWADDGYSNVYGNTKEFKDNFGEGH